MDTMQWRDILGTIVLALVLSPLFLFQFRAERRRRDLAQAIAAEGRAAGEAAAARASGQHVAIVIPVGWDVRASAEREPALLVRNFGPEFAQHVRAVARTEAERVSASARFVRPPEGTVELTEIDEGHDDLWPDDPPPRLRSTLHAWMRVTWANSDGTQGDSLWMRVRRLT